VQFEVIGTSLAMLADVWGRWR